MFEFLAPFMPKILLFFKPFILWFDHTFTIPFSVKKINADHYFMWKPRIRKGMIFVTDTYGQASNVINPSKGKHGAIYFGKGLKSYLMELTKGSKNLEWEFGAPFAGWYSLNIDKISDDIEYVIEALGHGVTATSVIKFLTTKDVVKGYLPLFVEEGGCVNAAENACHDLGLPYDFEFNGADNAKYCFEVVLDAYLKESPKTAFVMDDYFGYLVYTSNAFRDQANFVNIIDSELEFPELYR